MNSDNKKARAVIPLLKAIQQGGGSLPDPVIRQLDKYSHDEELKHFFTNLPPTTEQKSIPDSASSLSEWAEFISNNPDELIHREIPIDGQAHWVDNSNDPWDNFCRRNANDALRTLTMLHEQNVWPVGRWNHALASWESEFKERKKNPEGNSEYDFFLDYLSLFAFLENLQDSHFSSVLKHSLDLLKVYTSEFINSKNANEELFTRILTRCLHVIERENPISGIGKHSDEGEIDYVFHAINAPSGVAAEIALSYQFNKTPKYEDGLQDGPKMFLQQILDQSIPAFALGRCLIADRAIDLYLYDQSWTGKYLLPQFSWKNNPDAAAIWQGYLWSARWTPDFIMAIADDFVETSKHLEQLKRASEHYAQCLTYLALNKIKVISNAEYNECISRFDERNLIVSLSSVRTFFNTASNQSELWRSAIKPFLKSIWPQDKHYFDNHMVRVYLDIVFQAGDAFPEAVEIISHWLRLRKNDPHFYLDPLLKRLLPPSKDADSANNEIGESNINHFLINEPESTLILLHSLNLHEKHTLLDKSLLKQYLDRLREAGLEDRDEYRDLLQISQ